ncbi:efflux RND transporter periplasmic adaptor subunit [Mariprofundus sp. EBB-1]|uniref:efflux RND transporter periplasmic adaptor subunit n=1 Tax=Mariprofundus sp. EBB-1 TaxID=2650971 RepID=UPI000EF1C9D6|nr:efflux RND transporter periplasmic adaptor subunit [Mariprofundus sp. EBB-1]RLL51271.1 efflux RND transporter periplasmic adaptor subunit [Mariprofundus sp. EBB-1]
MKYINWVIVLACMLVCGQSFADEAKQQFDGLIEPDELISVSSPIPGVLDAVLFDKGDRVRKGQVIARLKSGVERASVNLAKVKYKYNARRLERNRELFEKKLLSQMDHDDIETETRISEMEHKQAEEQLKLRIIHSPISGIVVDKNYSAGEFVQEHVVMKIAKLNPLKVEVILPVEMFGKVHKGNAASIYIAGYDEHFSGKVNLVDPMIDAASETFAVQVTLPNKKYRLPAGLKCKVSFSERNK